MFQFYSLTRQMVLSKVRDQESDHEHTMLTSIFRSGSQFVIVVEILHHLSPSNISTPNNNSTNPRKEMKFLFQDFGKSECYRRMSSSRRGDDKK